MKNYCRKHRPVPVSFFAFQDIITALAGCMLIFVLIMAAAKYRFSSSGEPEELVSRAGYDLLQNKVTLKKSALEKITQKNKTLQKKFDVNFINEQISEQNKLLKSSAEKLEIIQAERSKMLQKMQAELAAVQTENQKLSAEKPELSALIKQSFQLEKQYIAQRRKLIFAEHKAKKNLILTISRPEWQLADAPATAPQVLGSSETALIRLKDVLRKFNEENTRLIIAVRPSAGGFIEPLKRALKQSFPLLETVAEPLADETHGGLKL